ncbi:MAG: terminase [Dehalococcoidia bacterium]
MTTAAPPAPPAPQSPVAVGPTWRRNEAGRFVLPRRTLAWQQIPWVEKYLEQPDGPDAGEPFRLTQEQMRFLAWWYAVDARGRFVYRAGMLRRMKGWGKDPFAVVICALEALGPCRFGGWDAKGEPIAVPHYAANVQIAAVSLDQVKRNTMSLFPLMLSQEAIAEFGIDLGKEIIYANGGRNRIELLTTSARSAEGPRPTFILKNETQHWIASNGGHDMSAVCARNAAKARDGATRTLAISNAHAPGELSDAELDYEGFMKGDAGFLYDSLEATNAVIEALNILKLASDVEEAEAERLRAQLHAELAACRGDSVWLDVDGILEVCLAPRTPVNEALRFYFNRLAAAEDRAFRRERWDELVVNVEPEADGPRDRRYRAEPGAAVTLGFDGSVNDDWTALIVTEIATGIQWPAGIWIPVQDDRGEWSIDVNEVDATVADLFETYEVWRMLADPFYWMEHLSKWAGKYNRPGHEVVISFSTTNLKATALAILDYRNAIEAGEVRHDGDERMAAAIGNSFKRMRTFRDDKGEQMFTIEKERPGSPLKIDPAMAGALSWRARRDAIAAGVLEDGGPVEVFWV